ncbi:MAG: alpha/beta hydrolase [Xanthomonadales bacterium]|nr:alpha/beta hydrolase [Xanthomonadales bacterium]
MSPATARSQRHRIAIAEVRGLLQLAAQATHGVTGMVEGVHQSVWRSLGAAEGVEPGRTRGLTGLVYRGIHGVSHVIGQGVDRALEKLQPILDREHDAMHPAPQRAAFLSVLNGVMGDHLVASGNPLAIPMSLRHRGRLIVTDTAPEISAASGRILLLVHGLCMNDLQWRGAHAGAAVEHGEAVAAALGYTPLHLRYNTGLHTSENGRELSERLEQLLAQWPLAIEEISIVAHSMGGLVARSACQHGSDAARAWRGKLRNIVFLGTPHHGAPLERAGQWVDQVLGRSQYTAPFAKLGQMRSAGITDLRHGCVRDEDWQGTGRFAHAADQRLHLPLPADIACFSIAATLAKRRSPLAERLVGDGLVPLRSALGRHDDAARDLGLHRHAHWISHGTGHIELLHRPEVGAQIIRWLAPQQD